MKLFTPISISPSPNKIDHQSNILTLGSCFSNHIGSLLGDFKFNISNNPFGTIFNSISIAKILHTYSSGKIVDKNRFHQNKEGYYFHYDFSGKLNDESQEAVAINIEKAFTDVPENLNWLIITLGTSYAYILNKDNQVVTNCHKVDQRNFRKEILSIEQQFSSLEKTLQLLKEKHSNLHVILTVSPVRHIKDGIVQNNRSKARLIEVSNKLADLYTYIDYFPSYEILIDELRDYRFYKDDLIHPNDTAVHIIWERFKQSYFAHETINVCSEIDKLNKLESHIPSKLNALNHQNQIIKLKQSLVNKYPFIKW